MTGAVVEMMVGIRGGGTDGRAACRVGDDRSMGGPGRLPRSGDQVWLRSYSVIDALCIRC